MTELEQLEAWAAGDERGGDVGRPRPEQPDDPGLDGLVDVAGALEALAADVERETARLLRSGPGRANLRVIGAPPPGHPYWRAQSAVVSLRRAAHEMRRLGRRASVGLGGSVSGGA